MSMQQICHETDKPNEYSSIGIKCIKREFLFGCAKS